MVRVVSSDPASQINALLSKRLAQERIRRGISKKRLAGMAGFDRSTVAFIENPAKNPTINNLIRYALALDIDLGKLISECQERSNPPKVRRAKEKLH